MFALNPQAWKLRPTSTTLFARSLVELSILNFNELVAENPLPAV